MKRFAPFLIAATLFAQDTRLPDAVQSGDLALVKSLLKSHADVNAAQGDGTTALHWAALRDEVEIAGLLIKSGANVKAVTRIGGITPLLSAAKNGNAPIIDLLLKAGADLNATNEQGTTPLMLAAASGSVDAVKLLLDRGASVNIVENAHGQTALMFAAALNRAPVVKLLLARGADPNISTKLTKFERIRLDIDGNVVPTDGAPPVPAAPAVATPEVVSQGGRRGGGGGRAGDVATLGPREVGATVIGGMSALLFAARDGQIEAARELVEGGANVNEVSQSDHTSPITMAIINGHFDVAKYLLDHGAAPNLANSAGLTPLYATIDVQWAPHAWFPQPDTTQQTVGYLDLMKALLARGANPNVRLGKKLWFRGLSQDPSWVDPGGSTAYWRAAQSSDVSALRLLVANGADPEIATTGGDTPLMVAAGIGWMANHTSNAPGGWMDAVRYCVELGADVKAEDSRGYTALHGAAYIGNNEMVNYLMAKGANIGAKSKAGDTVADLANGPTRFGLPHPETLALLEKLGSVNSHNCRSDQCIPAAKEERKPRTPAITEPVTPAPVKKLQ